MATQITPSYVTQGSSTGYALGLSGLAATAAKHLFAIEAGTTKTVRLRKITLINPGSQGSAGLRTLTLQRTTAAGSTGVVVPTPLLQGAGAYSGICRSIPGTNGTAGDTLAKFAIYVPNATAAFAPIVLADWTGIYANPPQISAGIANGIGLLDSGAASAADLCINVEFEE